MLQNYLKENICILSSVKQYFLLQFLFLLAIFFFIMEMSSAG